MTYVEETVKPSVQKSIEANVAPVAVEVETLKGRTVQ